MREIIRGIGIIKEDISNPCTQYDTDLYPDEKAVNDVIFYGHFVFFDDIFCKPECTQQRENIHDPVPMHRDEAQINGYGIEMVIDMVPVVHHSSCKIKVYYTLIRLIQWCA